MRIITLSLMAFSLAFGYSLNNFGAKLRNEGELRPYISIGLVSGGATHTDNSQGMSKDMSPLVCPDGTCTGDTTYGTYQGVLNNGLNLEAGGEYFFDKLKIFGFRVFGEFSMIGGGLGNLTSSSRDTSVNNLQEAYELCKKLNISTSDTCTCGIATIDSSATDRTFTFNATPDAQEIAPNSGKWISLGLGIDGIINVPVDFWLRKYLDFGDNWFLRRLGFLKVGIFVGGGVELSRFTKGSWQNLVAGGSTGSLSSNLNDTFLAAGSGGFLRYGISAYITRFLRINFGFKETFYDIASERWYAFNGAQVTNDGSIGNVIENDTWTQTTLRQKYVISKDREWFLSFALSF